jgi:histidinol-phosphate/aromatic aminotransferase/cobyric acid decarboxylase-like protein
MSKSRALAGLRVGYALGDAGLIEALRRVKDSFNSYPLGGVARTCDAVRQFNKPRTAPYLRITVGTEDDVRRLIAAAGRILGHE